MKLSDFESLLQQAKTLADLNLALKKILSAFGVHTFAFTYYSYYPNSLNKLKYEFATENYILWHNYYVSEGYEEIDANTDVVYHTNLPLFWDNVLLMKKATSPRELEMRKDSLAFGIEKGISIPVHGPNEDFAILLLVQMRGEKGLNHATELQYTFFAIAYYYYCYLQKLLLRLQKPKHKAKLSARELQCLILTAKNYSVAEIAENLKITERTVNYHIQRLNKKLGVKNKYQAVIKARQKDLF